MIGQGEVLSTPSKPLRLEHGPLKQLFLLPTSIWYHAAHLRDSFVATLPSVTQGLVQDDEPSSIGELIARFLAHIIEYLESRFAYQSPRRLGEHGLTILVRLSSERNDDGRGVVGIRRFKAKSRKGFCSQRT